MIPATCVPCCRQSRDFASGRVVTFADSREEAEMIAEAYDAEIETFDMGVLTLKLGEGRTVKSSAILSSSLSEASTSSPSESSAASSPREPSMSSL